MTTKELEEEEEILESLAVEQYWTDKWDNFNQIEKATLMHNYIGKKYNLNSFGIYVYAMEYLIKSGSLNSLNESIVNGLTIIPDKRMRDTEQEINTILLDTVAKMLKGLTEPEQTIMNEELNKEEPYEKPILQRLFEAYRMVKEKSRREEQAFNVIEEALK